MAEARQWPCYPCRLNKRTRPATRRWVVDALTVYPVCEECEMRAWVKVAAQEMQAPECVTDIATKMIVYNP